MDDMLEEFVADFPVVGREEDKAGIRETGVGLRVSDGLTFVVPEDEIDLVSDS